MPEITASRYKINIHVAITPVSWKWYFIFLLLNFQITLRIVLIRASHRNHKQKQTAKIYKKDEKGVTHPDEINPYPKFLHFLATDTSEEGVLVDPSSPVQNIHSFTNSRPAHGSRPRKIRHGRKRHGHRSILVKTLKLPIEDVKSLKNFASLPQPDAPRTITVITESGRILKAISPQQWDMAEEPVQSKDSVNKKMQKEVSLFLKYLKL